MSSDDLEDGELSDVDNDSPPAKVIRRGDAWSNLATEDLLTHGMQKMKSKSKQDRGLESYDWRQVKEDIRPAVQSSSEDDSEEDDQLPELPETFGLDVPKHRVKDRLGLKKERAARPERGSSKDRFTVKDRAANSRRHETPDRRNVEMEPSRDKGHKQTDKISAKQRLGKRQDLKRTHEDMELEYVPRPDELEEIPHMKQVNVSVDMDPAEVLSRVVGALGEPDSKVFGHVLEVLGIEKFVKLFKATSDVEGAGGLLVKDKSRRRTPGGVFLFLVRQESLTKEQYDYIFAEGFAMFKEKLRTYKKAVKKRKLNKYVQKTVSDCKDDSKTSKSELETVSNEQPTESNTNVDDIQEDKGDNQSPQRLEEDSIDDIGELDIPEEAQLIF